MFVFATWLEAIASRFLLLLGSMQMMLDEWIKEHPFQGVKPGKIRGELQRPLHLIQTKLQDACPTGMAELSHLREAGGEVYLCSNKSMHWRNSNKKLLGAPGIATRSKDATRGSWQTHSFDLTKALVQIAQAGIPEVFIFFMPLVASKHIKVAWIMTPIDFVMQASFALR